MYKIKVGISACLLGQEVRFDGGHKRSSFCERDLGAHFDYHPVCPEMAIGLGAPVPPSGWSSATAKSAPRRAMAASMSPNS